jgi:hypothetical protein
MKESLLKYGLPLLIVSVVLIQFYQVYFQNLSPWKGGGFGMYSTYHPASRQIWAKVNTRVIHIQPGQDSLRRLGREIFALKINPDKENTTAFAHRLSAIYACDSIRLYVWEPNLDIHRNVLKARLLNQVHYVVRQ